MVVTTTRVPFASLHNICRNRYLLLHPASAPFRNSIINNFYLPSVHLCHERLLCIHLLFHVPLATAAAGIPDKIYHILHTTNSI